MTGNVVYVLPNTMGGTLNIVAALVEHRPADAMPAHVVFTENANVQETRFDGAIARAASQRVVKHQLPHENLHAVLRRLQKAIPEGPGVLVCNDLLDLALPHVWDSRRMVVQILHGDYDYYYDLAERHQGVVDLFVAYSRAVYDRLRARLPHRAADVLHLPYGVTLPTRRRQRHAGRLRVVFAGRIDAQKGVFDLPEIDALLERQGITVDWTVIGGGPDEVRLRETWRSPRVQWRGVLSRTALLEALPDFDVFVLPSRAEGLSVALVEAMGAGLATVVSDLESGIPELIDDGVEGFRRPVGDNAGFAEAIARLACAPAQLESMSAAAVARVQQFDAKARAAAYEAVFASWPERRRLLSSRPPLPYGSRLDRRWIPNAIVQSIRTARGGRTARTARDQDGRRAR